MSSFRARERISKRNFQEAVALSEYGRGDDTPGHEGHEGVLADAGFHRRDGDRSRHPDGIPGEAGAEATEAAADLEAQAWQTTARNDAEVPRPRTLPASPLACTCAAAPFTPSITRLSLSRMNPSVRVLNLLPGINFRKNSRCGPAVAAVPVARSFPVL